MKQQAKASPAINPAALTYLLLALGGLAVLVLLQVGRENLFDLLVAPLILLVGVVGLLARFRSAALMVILVLGLSELLEANMRPGGMHSLNLDVFDPAVTLRCCALLAYVIGHYRRLALTVHLFPIDPREQTPSRPGRRFRSRKQPVLLKRSTQQIRPLEMVLTILALPIFALLAQYLWLIITAAPRNILGFPPQLSRFFLLSWLAFLGLYAASALLDYWRWRRMTSAQAQLYLQDLLWQETRREQRRLNRWLAIEHLRGRTAKQITPSPRLRGEGRNCVTPTYRPGSSSKSKSPWYP